MKGTILALAVAGALMMAGCGGGGSKSVSMTPTSAPEPSMLTWELLPTMIPLINASVSTASSNFPYQVDHSDTSVIFPVFLDAATEPTGTMRRFRGTRTLQLEDGRSVTGNFWGGWLNNSIFLVENIPGRNEVNLLPYWRREIAAGIINRDNREVPVTGVYRGDAVDGEGNWGTSELNYTGTIDRGQLDLTIDIPAHRHRGTMSWSNIPVFNRDIYSYTFNHSVPFRIIGPNSLSGSFYQGGEVGGRFNYRWSLATEDSVRGAFGAKLTPDEP